jgi:hypothetical protein
LANIRKELFEVLHPLIAQLELMFSLFAADGEDNGGLSHIIVVFHCKAVAIFNIAVGDGHRVSRVVYLRLIGLAHHFFCILCFIGWGKDGKLFVPRLLILLLLLLWLLFLVGQ